MRPLSASQFPNLRWVSQNEPSDDGPLWSAFHNGRYFVADSERALLIALVEVPASVQGSGLWTQFAAA